MIVNLINVLFHFRCEPRSYLAAAGFASEMGCIGVELPFEIDQDWLTWREFFIRDWLLKLRVSLIDFGVERGGVEALTGHSELVDKREFKISQAFDLRV